MTEYVITDKMREWGKANGYNVDIHADFFNDYITNRNGKPYRDLDAAFRNCVRSDWGGLRRAYDRLMQSQPKTGPLVRDTFVRMPDDGIAMPEKLRNRYVRGA